jgi:hypothetical protein
MAKVEIYFPETMATQKKNSEGKIRFDLSFNDDFDSAKNNTQNSFINNFATTSTPSNINPIATKLYINLANTFPALSDPFGNYATHYLVISLNDSKTYIAIPICNNYQENFIKYVKKEYLEKTLTRSIDKLLKIARSNIPDAKILIDLNSTMNELKGTPKSYKKYTSKLNETDADDSEIYVIDKFIYVEPAIKTSFYEQIIKKKIYGLSEEGTYSIANVTAICEPNSGRSPVYKLFKKQDWGELVMYNIFMTVGYFLFFVVWYYCYNKIGKDYVNYICLGLLTTPFWVYFGLVRELRVQYHVYSARPWHIRNKETTNRKIDESVNGYKTKQQAERALKEMDDESLYEVYEVYVIRNQHGSQYNKTYKTRKDADMEVKSLNTDRKKGSYENDVLIKRTILSMCYSGIILSIYVLYLLYLGVMYLMTKSFLKIPSEILEWLKKILFSIYYAIKFMDWKYLMPFLKVLFILLNLGLVSWGIIELFKMVII